MERILEGPAVVFYLFGLAITETVVNTWIIMVVLIGFALIARRRLELYPSKFQNFVELIIESIDNLVKSTMGEERKGFTPYMACLFLFLALSNISGIFGFRPPSADINFTGTLAGLTFGSIHFYGLKKKGFGHIKGLAEPLFLFLPLNIIGELAKPVSLAMRLFGNIFGGAVIMAMIGSAVALFIPILPSLYFDLFTGILQSFIFVMLTMVFITLALE